MSIFAISDLHLPLGADKSMDIFRGWENYVERLEQNWLATVKPEDTVVLAGDLSWALKLADTEKDFAFLEALPGKKLLLKGNHDLWWDSVTKMRRFFETRGFGTFDFIRNNAYLVDGLALCGTRGWFFDDPSGDKKMLLREAGRLEASIAAAEKTGGLPVVFLHYPPVTRERECPEICEVLRAHHIKHVYYGHLHGASATRAVCGNWNETRLELISADFLKFKPLKMNYAATSSGVS
ncbi:MAG: metallophosphoesterase, partial [Oscillospiraceae bacterium]|nr:metallophosphoesterase [Oscillospiraceae bacterium]